MPDDGHAPSSCCAPAPAEVLGATDGGPRPARSPWDTLPRPSAEQIAQVRSRAESAILIPAGPFRMGTADPDANPHDGERPVRTVEVGAFRIDPACITVSEFAAFTADTGHVSTAEELGWSYVFAALLDPAVRRSSPRPPGTPWWRAVEGATWFAPEGPGTSVADRLDHPVVHVSTLDALAFARWCRMRLPTEPEWEKAARGGLDQARYAWGDELTPGGEHRCNIFQGIFPTRNTAEDGYLATSPARAFPPNGFGLHGVAGNVWERTSTPWTLPSAAHAGARQQAGPLTVIKGGSYLCHDSYCNRYRVAARTATSADDSAGNSGFRLAADA